MAYDISKYIVNKRRILLKHELCHADHAFPLACERNVRGEGECDEQLNHR